MIKNILLGFMMLTAMLSFIGSAKMYLAIKKYNGEPSDKEVKSEAAKLGTSIFLWLVGMTFLFIAYKIHE
jgi:hypothetical protein